MIATTVTFRLLALSVCLAVSPTEGDLGLQRTNVFVSGVDGYDTYRIPALIVTREGTLLAFGEGRKSSRGDSGNIDLLLKRSTDGYR